MMSSDESMILSLLSSAKVFHHFVKKLASLRLLGNFRTGYLSACPHILLLIFQNSVAFRQVPQCLDSQGAPFLLLESFQTIRQKTAAL